MAGITPGNNYYTLTRLPKVTEEICKDPRQLAQWLTRVEQRLNTELRRFRAVRLQNVYSGQLCQVGYPGFQVGAVFFSHATRTGPGWTSTFLQNTSAGYLQNVNIQPNGPISFIPLVAATGATHGELMDISIVLMEAESAVK